MNRKNIFIVWVIVFTIAVAYSVRENRILAKSNRAAITKLATNDIKLKKNAVQLKLIRKAQRDSCTNYEELRQAVNQFHRGVDKFLSIAENARQHSYETAGDPMDLRAAHAYAKVRSEIHTVSKTCVQHRNKKK